MSGKKDDKRKESTEEAKKRLSHTRYDDDFLAKPKLSLGSSSRRSSVRIDRGESGEDHEETDFSDHDQRKRTAVGNIQERIVRTPKQFLDQNFETVGNKRKRVDISLKENQSDDEEEEESQVITHDAQSSSLKESTQSISLNHVVKKFTDFQRFLKIDKRLRKLVKDVNEMDRILAAHPLYQDLPFTTLRDLLIIRLHHEEAIKNYIDSTNNSIAKIQKNL